MWAIQQTHTSFYGCRFIYLARKYAMELSDIKVFMFSSLRKFTIWSSVSQ